MVVLQPLTIKSINNMLKKKERLTKKEFDRFFSSGKRSHSELFSLIYSPTPTFHSAVVVGKKVYKKAVNRNLLRRRLYNIIYRESREKNLKGVYIVLAKPAVKGVSFKALREALLATIKIANKHYTN